MFPSALSFKYLIYREHFFPYQEFNISILSFAWNHLTSTALYAHTYCVLAFYSLEVTFSLWLHWTYHIPISLGVLMLQRRQVPLQLSYLRLKPDHLTIELSVMTLRNVRNGGPTRPEVCFLSTLIPKRREMATQYHQSISTAETLTWRRNPVT